MMKRHLAFVGFAEFGMFLDQALGSAFIDCQIGNICLLVLFWNKEQRLIVQSLSLGGQYLLVHQELESGPANLFDNCSFVIFPELFFCKFCIWSLHLFLKEILKMPTLCKDIKLKQRFLVKLLSLELLLAHALLFQNPVNILANTFRSRPCKNKIQIRNFPG